MSFMTFAQIRATASFMLEDEWVSLNLHAERVKLSTFPLNTLKYFEVPLSNII